MNQTKEELVDYVLRATEYYIPFFPFRAVRVARKVREELIPELVKRVEFALSKGKELPDDYMGHIYALFLLAEFRVKETYELMLRFFFLEEEEKDHLMGDGFTEDFGPQVASVAGGRYEELLEIFQNRELCEYSRGIAFGAIQIQLNNGLIKEEELLYRLESILETSIKEKDVVAVTELVIFTSDFKVKKFENSARKAFDSSLVDTFMFSLKCFEDALKKEKSYGKAQHEQMVVSTEESMQCWHCFQPKKGEQIKRNQLCLCKSGLKYKKCCLV